MLLICVYLYMMNCCKLTLIIELLNRWWWCGFEWWHCVVDYMGWVLWGACVCVCVCVWSHSILFHTWLVTKNIWLLDWVCVCVCVCVFIERQTLAFLCIFMYWLIDYLPRLFCVCVSHLYGYCLLDLCVVVWKLLIFVYGIFVCVLARASVCVV